MLGAKLRLCNHTQALASSVDRRARESVDSFYFSPSAAPKPLRAWAISALSRWNYLPLLSVHCGEAAM
jgi:hypothetical protein